MPKTILVTGAAGLLGSQLCRLLAEMQNRVIAIVKPGSPTAKIENVTYLEKDLSGSFSLSEIDKLDAIFHLAQAGGHTDFIRSASNISAISVSALCRLAEFACETGAKKLIFTSSGGVYGGGPDAFDEKASVKDEALSFYLESKKAAENLLNHFTKHLDINILRPFFIYGPGQRPEMLISRMKKAILEKKEIFLSGGQGPLLNPIYVTDAAKAAAACIQGNLPKVINIAGNEIVSLRKICEILGEKLRIVPIFTEKADPVLNFIGDNHLMRCHLHSPETALEDGLKSIC